MANQEGFGKLSQEQIQKLAGTISEAKNLTGQQEEIIKRVLAGETEIGNLRISSLEKYFDIYSKNLDLVARKHSTLSDAFLILEEKLTTNYKTLSSDITKLEQQLADLSKQSRELTTNSAADIARHNGANKESAIKSDGKHIELLSNILGEFKELRNYITAKDDGLPQSITQEIAANPSSNTHYTGDIQNTVDSVDVQNLTANTDRAAMRTQMQAQAITELAEAEKKAQDLLAQLRSQLTAAQPGSAEELELGSDRARAINAAVDYDAAKKLEDQIADYRAKLNYETMLRTGKALTAEQAAANEELVKQEFADIDAKLSELKQHNALTNISPRLVEANEKKKAALIANLEYQERKKNQGKLTEEQKKAIQRLADEKYKLDEKNLEKLEKQELKRQEKEQRARAQAGDAAIHATVSGPLTKDHSLLDRFKELKEIADDSDDANAGLAVAIKAISDLAAQLNDSIDKIASYKGDIDTRLQGSKNETASGSYWGQLTKDMMSVGSVTPFFKQEKFAENIKSLVDQGIAFDLKQRAFLMTIQEKIANTFNVADGTLLRLIRIQQEDSTAGRLGMESALNAFLNNMYENTEYLRAVADGVRNSLQEMEAMMSGAEATEVEYQVQKWMGSLYSVGMSQEAVNSISTALGQIAAGQVDALTNGNGAGNLLVMAANEAGKSISEILTKGLNAKETNELLQATVNYLAELADASKDNRVVQQQLANVFGVKASDLIAATNLASGSTTNDIYKSYLTYDNMLNRLNEMANTMYLRTSLGEMMTNVWANGQYSLASSMASNPVAYLLYKVASLLEAATGGINIPFVSVLGSGVDLNTTVADLMRVASISTGIIGSLGDMISGLSSSFSGQAMLANMGIEKGSGLKVNVRGTGDGIGASEPDGGGQRTISSSGYVGNSSSSDIKNATMQESENTKKQLMIEAKEEAAANQIDFINTNVLKIYELLDEVANGKRSLSVKVSGYGLTNLGSNTSLNGAQGGVAGLLSNNAANNPNSNPLSGGFNNGSNTSGSSSSGHSSGSVNSSSGNGGEYSVGTGIDLGGWTIM